MRIFMIVVATLSMFLLPPTVTAQTTFWAESQNKVDLNVATLASQINVSVSHPINKRVGMFLWALQSKGWGEIYLGPTYKTASGIEVGVGLGLESDPNPMRSAAYLFMTHKQASLYTTAETGGSGPWYQAIGNVAFKAGLMPMGAGFLYERFVGLGPRFEASTLEKHMMLWVVPIAYDFENERARNMLIGIRLIP